MKLKWYPVLVGAIIALSLAAIILATIIIWQQAKANNQPSVRLVVPTGTQ